MKVFTVITGATGGLGKAFSSLLYSKGENLILTGRSEEKLNVLKGELSSFGSGEIIVKSCDLSSPASRQDFFDYLSNSNVKIGRLINVAGVDIQKGFEKYTQEKIRFQCSVNLESAISLCLFCFEHRADELEILNISSVSGIYPMPYFALYSATKSALTSFSMALREEWKDKNVKVTAVLPGAMPTRQDIKDQIRGQGLWGKLAALPPETVAKKSLIAVRKNKAKYVVGFFNRLMNVGTKLIPLQWKLAFIKRRWSKIEKDAF